MKRIFALLLCALMIASFLAACQGNDNSAQESKKKKIELTVPYTYSGVSLMLPTGFYTQSGDGYAAARVRGSNDNVVFMEVEADKAENYTDEDIENSIKVRLGNDSFKAVNIERRKTDGIDTFVIKGTFEQKKQTCKFIEICVFLPDRSVIINYTMMTDTYSEAFEKSAESIRIIK